MEKGRRMNSNAQTNPTTSTMRLFDPGMSPIHRAGLGGLACTLRYIEKAYRDGDLRKEDVPSTPWIDGKPPWEIKPLQITLDFGNPRNAGSFLETLFACAFCLKEKLIYLPAQHRTEPSIEVLAELQRGLLLSFLQHGSKGVRQLQKEETPIAYEVDGRPLQVTARFCSFYKHQKGWEQFCNKSGELAGKPVKVVGPLNPGAVVRHVAFDAQTKIEEDPAQALPLYFALVGCLALPINRGSGVLLVPEVTDLQAFAKLRPGMTPNCIRECRITGTSDAALQAQVRLTASKLILRHNLPGCFAVRFKPTPWASQQKSRVEVTYVPPSGERQLQQFQTALAELPPRIVSPKIRQSNGDSGPKYFWADSVVRPLVADNLASGQPWYRGFVGLMRKTDPVTKRPIRDRLVFEKGGLHAMIEKITWEDRGESAVVRAVHEALRLRYGRIADENRGNPGTMKNRWRGEYDRWRLAFSGAKTSEQFRHSLCDLFGRAGINRVLRDQWPEVLPLLDASRWQLTRDLALLALASYKGKGADEIATTVDETASNAE